MSRAEHDPVLSPHEVAERLGRTYPTVLEYLRSRQLDGVKRGNRWYIRQSSFDSFLDAVPGSADVA